MRAADRRHTLVLLASILLLSAPQLALAQSCSMTFDKNPVLPGEGTTLRWSLHLTFLWMLDANQTTQFYISPIGRMWANQLNLFTWVLSNSVWVAPMTTTEYVGTMPNNNPLKRIATCSATLTVVQQPTAVVVPLPPPAANVLSCSITFEKNPISSGQNTSISWSSTEATLFYINGIGYVGGSGSAPVSPGSTSDYSGYVSDASGATVSCPATLTVSNSCPPGQVLINGKCTQSCPPGFTYRDGQCVFVGCPLGYVRQGDKCVFSACPAGYYKDGDQCVRATQCTTPPKCVGDDLINSCTGALIRSCDWGCTGSACNPIPAPSATLKATPALVRSGVITTASWTGTNVTSCTVHGTNGDSWTGKSSTGRTSSPINGQTIYTLHCNGYSGAQPPSVDKSVTVNLVPSFNEQ